MKPFLLIGGPSDGTTRRTDGEHALVFSTVAHGTVTGSAVYRLEKLPLGGKTFAVYVYDRITLAEAIERLLTHYHPEVPSCTPKRSRSGSAKSRAACCR